MAEETTNATPQEEQNLSEQTQIRIGKLNALSEAGNNPYRITKYDRTHLSSGIVEH